MSTSSSAGGSARRINRRIESLQRPARNARSAASYSSPKTSVSSYDAYTYALRVAYLAHLLSPRARRTQPVAPPPKPAPSTRSSSASVVDLVRDFSLVRDSKSTRFPHGFMAELDKRITNVLMGKEKMPEFADPMVKRTFAVFLNEFKKPDFRKSMEKDRRVEDLLLIFFSNATKELQKGKPPGDDSWKLLVDRHVALFVRLITSTIKSNDWHRDRPELSARLQTLESKLLIHDQDLTSKHGSSLSQSTTVEIEVPKSADVRDMPLVQTVCDIFNKALSQAQGDIDAQKDLWTEKTALQDLKMYQTNLNLNSRKTLRSDDFDTAEAFEAWKKAEVPDLSQMMLAIIQSNLELAKDSSGALPQYKPTPPGVAEPHYLGNGRSGDSDSSSYVFDQPVDVSGLNLDGDGSQPDFDDGQTYMFIPPDSRAYYRAIVKEALRHDKQDASAEAGNGDAGATKLLSKRSTELLSELGLRWRVPFSSRLMLFFGVVQELFIDQELDIGALEAAFRYVKEPNLDKKKADPTTLLDRTKWPLADFVLNQQILSAIHDTLLRDLFSQLLRCYDSQPPEIGGIMEILETHLYDDPTFTGTPEDLDKFAEHLQVALRDKAAEIYEEMKQKQVLHHGESIDFFHVIQLGKAVLKLLEKIQKRYRKMPSVMQVEPFPILLETALPAFASDARALTAQILERVAQAGEELPIQDGFDLYQEMTEMRRVHQEALPDVEFGFHVEGLLANFAWKWIQSTDANILPWVENAVKQDSFQVGTADNAGDLGDEQRHSSSVTDVFRSFTQAIEKIIDLRWDDDYQHAKFMTALSKSVSIGMERYAELLEGYFTKEMDRLTPAQEVALTQSRQEKWMKMAREAVSTNTKVEPFQFLQESFVKLNDIEQAMQLLDKLEKDINVDACADIIQKKEPPAAQRQRRLNRYVFTIKIIEAEDLRACDANGLSDPYVVLGDEFQKRLAKTRIIYASLNPRWDETIDITTTGLMNVTATIWDYDLLGDHDCVGRTTIKLDPTHFSDFLPREYWLDLDTQGRLLVRISMEGEKDDIQFYFGKAFRALKRTERDMTRRITDKLSAYIQYCLSRRALKAVTRQNISISSVSSMFTSRTLKATPTPVAPSQQELAAALEPLFNYLNDNFAIMRETLTSTAMIAVMARVWKEVLSTIESLLVPPLSDKPSSQTQLTSIELDVVFKWLGLLFDFFHAVDDETKQAHGVPVDLLKSAKYHDLQNLNFFYYEPTETLIRTSERMATATTARRQTAPPGALLSPSGALALPSRAKSTFQARNLGTMKAAKAKRRQEAQAEPSDDMILRILRMRPEAARYLRDRARQKERLAAAAAAEAIVQRSLAQGAKRREELERRRAGT